MAERIADTRAETGEGPLWHPEEDRLYWVDIPPGHLYRYDPTTGDHERVYETDDGSPLGGYTIQTDGALCLFTDDGRVSRWDPAEGGEAEEIARVGADTRFNDVIADPEGRVFCGTMPGEELGDLYRLEPDGSWEVVVENVDIANGMGFSRDLETFYFTESEGHRIYEFDYDRETGAISNRRTFVETPPDDGIPDGMTVDEDDYVWSARWDGGRAVRYDGDGEVIAEVEVPARKVSSVTFGGDDYEDLYLTTALGGPDATRDEEGDGAGAVFRYSDVEVPGVPEFRSAIGER